MTSLLLHPVLPFALGALLAPLAGEAGRRLLRIAAPAAALLLLLSLPDGATASVVTLGHEWVLLRADGLARVFALAFVLYALVAGVYAWEETGTGPAVAALGLAGAGVGVVLAGDLLSLFLFWEWLTVASLFLIWFGNTPGAWGAGFRYLMFHLLGATLMLVGILMRLADGQPTFSAMPLDGLAAWLILAGMATNAAVPPLHAWLADSYPRAGIHGTVYLAAFTTKGAVYALARGFPGAEPLLWAGGVMAVVGTVYALLENDIRRLMVYSIMSQLGYMVAGVGLGTALALNGAAAHAFSHIFYKGLLLMAAGAVIHATGRGRLHQLGQLAGPMRGVLLFTVIGALSISAAPFFSGFVSKSMVLSAAGYEGRGALELVLLAASAGTILHTGFRLIWFTFFGEDQGARAMRPVPASMYAAMGMAAAVCLLTGVFPAATLYALLPFDTEYHPYTAHHLVESLQMLLATGLGFWLLRHRLAGAPVVSRDVDLLYRAPVRWLVEGSGNALKGLGRRAHALAAGLLGIAWDVLRQYQVRVGTPTLAVQTSIIIGALAIAAWIVVVGR